MSDQVISLSSSDEDDDKEPSAKRRKVTPDLPECTVTLVSTKPIESASETIETVSLDSDDETSENKNEKFKKTFTTSASEVKEPLKSLNSSDNVDLISLTDDEEDNVQPKVNKVNGTNNSLVISKATKGNSLEINQETVSIDDSDTEVELSKKRDNLTDKTKADKKNKQGEEKNSSIIIDDSDDETEKENHCENEHIETFSVDIEKTSATDVAAASTSKLGKKHLDRHKTNVSNSQKGATQTVGKELIGSKDELEEAKGLFKRFIRMMEEKIVDSSFEEILPKKVPIIKKYFNRSGSYVNDKVFKDLLIDSIERIRKSTTASGANSAVLSFHKIFEHLKSHVAETTIIVEEDNLPKIKKLEHTIKLLRKRIHQLETAEVNFDDDEDSAYIMLDRYQCRLNKVYAKYCQYINRNPFSGRATYDRITFVNSSYNEINQALTRKYKNSLVFPSYYELENYITKIAKKEKLNLSESDIKIESKKCFKVLGNILQKKRRQELYDSHLDFVESSEDPATKDISLENVLKKNFVEGKEKIEKLYQKYVNKQERGEDHVSTDEEQSSEESEDDDNKNKKSVKKSGKINTKKGDKIEKETKKNKQNQEKQNSNKNEVVERQDQSKTESIDLEDNNKKGKDNYDNEKVNQEEIQENPVNEDDNKNKKSVKKSGKINTKKSDKIEKETKKNKQNQEKQNSNKNEVVEHQDESKTESIDLEDNNKKGKDNYVNEKVNQEEIQENPINEVTDENIEGILEEKTDDQHDNQKEKVKNKENADGDTHKMKSKEFFVSLNMQEVIPNK